MKKYIAPEMEITNFKAVDILTASDVTTITPADAPATVNADNPVAFSDEYGGFDQ